MQLNVVRLDLLCELSSSQLRHLQLRLVVRKYGRNLFDNQILELKKLENEEHCRVCIQLISFSWVPNFNVFTRSNSRV